MRKVAIVVPLALVLLGLAWIWWRETQWTRPRPAIDLASIRPPAAAPAPDAPNVVMLIGCSVRADQLTPWDARIPTTPFLERLAADGVQFLDTIAQAPWTKPGVTAIVTGQDPLTTGIPDPSDDGADRRVLAPDNVTLAERFHDAGYTTIGITGNPNINTLFGFDQGFDVYVDTPTLWRDRHGKVDGADLVNDALDVVDRLRARADLGPLYLQLLFVDAHFPATNVSDADAAEFGDVGRHTAKYRAMLKKLDGHLERLVGGLEAFGMTRANTVFVFVGDHGDGLNFPSDRHGIGHGNYLYSSTVHVPWILSGKGVPAGVKVGGVSAQVDIAPTLIELAHLEDSYRGPGLSLVPLYTAPNHLAQRVQPSRAVFTDTWFHKSNRAAIYREDRMCQKNFGEPDERFPDACFDRSSDPKLERPFDDAALTAELLAWRAARTAEFEARGTMQAELQPEIIRELRALGYVD
jgi:arylsulfatase A-like enzyme